jgi:hypothetical protein
MSIAELAVRFWVSVVILTTVTSLSIFSIVHALRVTTHPCAAV